MPTDSKKEESKLGVKSGSSGVRSAKADQSQYEWESKNLGFGGELISIRNLKDFGIKRVYRVLERGGTMKKKGGIMKRVIS